MLELEQVSLRRQGRWSCQGISLQVEPGQVVGVIGPNGAGKSTALGLLSGEIAPTRGVARLDGQRLSGFSPLALAKRRAVMLQHTSLMFGFEVEEIVSLGLTPHEPCAPALAQAHIAQAMALAGVEHLADRRYMALSGGERQRVQFARALVQLLAAPAVEREGLSGRYLLLDEPVASLDLAYAHALLWASRALAKQGAGVLVILHDLNLAARYADQLVVLRQGRVFTQGSPQEVLTVELLDQVFGLKAKVVLGGQAEQAPLVVVHGPKLLDERPSYRDVELPSASAGAI